jgi:hypothetical protein
MTDPFDSVLREVAGTASLDQAIASNHTLAQLIFSYYANLVALGLTDAQALALTGLYQDLYLGSILHRADAA